MKRLFSRFALVALVALFAAGCESPAGDLETPGEAAAPLSAEAQSALALLPAQASFLAVADAQALRQGDAFDSDTKNAFTGEAGARLRDFFDATGFDPAHDVQNVYAAAGPGAAPQLIVAADFDRARFMKALDGEKGDRFEKTTYRGHLLYRADGARRAEHAFSFALTHDGLILFAPSPDGVRQMIDRLETGSDSLTDDADLMRLADQVRGRGDTWFVARGLRGLPFSMGPDSTGRQARLQQLRQIEKIIRRAAGALSLEDGTADGELFLYTQDGADPDDLQNALEGLVAMLSKRDDLPAEKRRALDSIDIERSGDAVHVSFSFPMSDV